ncbi:hypothetical protein DFQ27_009978 [Actinomortierella ambigua]|uniref:SWIM-type domain-containing protein n=1 Tax=Actinomortierella ambigua TaxID=1343610 RepID=A0A9P6PNF6_9FUNG|nr:hypothetical protein DFQ27_009978 [Actinomortierella ambigua]
MKNRYSTEERLYELRPTAFITDQGSAEISAFRSAFGGLGVQLHFCRWHIDRIWIRELSKRVVYKPGDTLDQKKELRSRMMKQLIAIQTERKKDTAFAMIDQLCLDWANQASMLHFLKTNYFGISTQAIASVEPTVVSASTQVAAAVDGGRGRARGRGSAGGRGGARGRGGGSVSTESARSTAAAAITTTPPSGSISHAMNHDESVPEINAPMEPDDDFDRYYDMAGSFGQGRPTAPKENWMVCFRQGSATGSIDTNNLIESWHNTLKRHFFRDRLQRPDHVMYILAYVAVPKFKEACDPELANVGRASTTEVIARGQRLKARTHLERRADKGYSEKCVIVLDNDKEKRGERSVESFQGPQFPRYTIRITYKAKRGYMVSCTCPWFFQNRTYCKHMGLVHVYDGGAEDSLLTSFTYGAYNHGIPAPPPTVSSPKVSMVPARLKAQISEIKEQPEVHPANVETEAQEAVEQLEELVAAIKRDPTYFARFREDIDIESIRHKQQLYRKRQQGQQTSYYKPRKRHRGFGEIEGQSESIEEEDEDGEDEEDDDEEDEGEDEDEEDDGDD